ncbi:hypothetical protein S83_051365, partial [Arachis hypogaea]
LKRELRSTHPTVLRVSLLVYSISVNTTTTTSKERFGLKRKTVTSLVYLINKERKHEFRGSCTNSQKNYK